MELYNLNITQINEGLKKGDFSAVELCQAFLERIGKINLSLNAFLTFNKENALARAKEIDDKILLGREIGVLEGVPFAVKDNILVKGLKCTAGSKILENYIAPYDATVIRKLKKAGAIILGKTNLDEFAMGSSTENSAFGPTRNPRDLERVPGGSSGGSAAAVASNLCSFALGSDTGGSVRQPASLCGVVGFKPTYGAVSRFGLIAFGSSLDQIGPITKTVFDAKIVFDAIKGKDPQDSTSSDLMAEEKEVYAKDLKIGLPKEYFIKGMQSGVEKAISEAINVYKKLGAEMVEISLPHTKYALACYYIIAPCEASANLARFDGIKYGFFDKENQDLMGYYFKTRGKGFGEEVRRRIMLGTYALSSGFFDAYYLKAQKARTLIRQDFEKAFHKVDVILTPTSPTVAFKIGEKVKDPLSMYLSDIFTIASNLAMLPAISVPGGESDALPVGFQIIGNMFEEQKVLQTALLFEQNKK